MTIVKMLSFVILQLTTATNSTAQHTQHNTLLENIADVIARALTGVWTTSRSVFTNIVHVVSAACAAIINIIISALTYILEQPQQLHDFATDLNRKQTYYWEYWYDEATGLPYFIFPNKMTERQCGLIVIVTALFLLYIYRTFLQKPKAEISCVFDEEVTEEVSDNNKGDCESTILQTDTPAADDAEDVLLFFPNGDHYQIIRTEDDGKLYDTDDDIFNSDWTSIDDDPTGTEETVTDVDIDENAGNSQTDQEYLDKLDISEEDEGSLNS